MSARPRWLTPIAAGARTRLRWVTLIAAGALGCAAVAALTYLAVPPHARLLASVRAQCAPLPGRAHAACIAPTIHDLVTWTGHGLAIGTLLVPALFALHPWWVRRRRDLVPLDDDASAELRAELANLSAQAGLGRATRPAGPAEPAEPTEPAGPTEPTEPTGPAEPTGPPTPGRQWRLGRSARQPTWLLAPYAYTEEGRAFGLPWRPSVRIDVGLGILFHTDRPRFRAAITHELERLRHRAAGARYLVAGCLITLTATMFVASPAAHPASSIDACLLGYWTAVPRLQTMLLSDATAAVVADHGAIWSFTGDGTATLYLGEETVRKVAYAGNGTIRWRMTAHQGRVDLTEPAVEATLTGPGGVHRVPDAGQYALPPAYTCTENTTTTMADEYAIVLHRVGAQN